MLTPEEIDITTPRPLRCTVTECHGSPFAPQHGWHLVSAKKLEDAYGDRKREAALHAASAFTCTEHLPAVEEAVAAYCRDHATEAWEVETFRMYGWDDDGRGSAYITATGDPAALF